MADEETPTMAEEERAEMRRLAGELPRVDFDLVRTLAYQAGGAATGPLLQDHPDYVFPSESVAARVEELLTDYGFGKRG